MLDQVVLQSAVPKTLNITTVDFDEILVVKSISGLLMADIVLFTGDFARDGGYYQGRRFGKRHPVFDFKLNPDYTNDVSVSDIRELLYRMFLTPNPGDDGLQVVLKDDRKPDRYFIGHTEMIESDMWAKDQTAQVPMTCVDPFLRSVDLFHWDETFPGVSTLDFEYVGSAPTGLSLIINIVVDTPEILLNLQTGSYGQELRLVNPFGDFMAGQSIIVNTVIGSREIKYGGADVMTMLTADSVWLKLQPAEYTLEVSGTSYLDGKALLGVVEYRGAWWGI